MLVYYGLDLLLSKLSKAPVAERSVSGTLSISGTIVFPLTLIRMTKDEKGLAFFNGLLL